MNLCLYYYYFPPLVQILWILRLISNTQYLIHRSLFLMGHHSCLPLAAIVKGFLTVKTVMGWSCEPHAQPSASMARVSLFIRVIPFNLCGMRDLTTSYATAGIAHRIIKPSKPHFFWRGGGQYKLQNNNIYSVIFA